MAAGETAVNRAAMAQAAQQVESAVTVIRGYQSTMNGYTSQLQGGWQGQASSAFMNAYEAFSADFAKVLSALATIQENLVSTHGTYQATEETNTSAVNRVAGMIGG
jgi:WXG100 family type VII secretion target